MKKKKSNVNKTTIISTIIVLLVLCLSIGWSSFNSVMHLGSLAMVRINSDVRVTGFTHSTSTNGAVSNGEEYNVKSVSASLNLPNSNSTITYRVEITNIELDTNTYMGIKSITGLPNNLTILNITDYTLKDKLCDNNDPTDCGSGSQKSFYITVGYKDNNSYDSNDTNYGFTLQFEFKKVYDINYSGFTNPPISPTTVMDGDMPVITFNSDVQDILNVISGGNTLVLGTDYTYTNKVMTFINPVRNHLYISNPSVYNITYELNGGIQANNQVTTYTDAVNQTILSPTKTDYIFGGWYLNSGFTGDDIRNTSQITGDVTLYANWVNQKARIGNNYYASLASAISAVTTSDETTIELLANSSEKITIGNNRNIILDLKNNTLSNSGNNPVIANSGHLTIINGTITSNANQGVINNTSTLNITGGTISATGSRQAIYNSGVLNISGGIFTSTTTERATIQNLAAGNITITGGTVTSTGSFGLENAGTLKIGTKGHGVSTTSPSIKGETYGISATQAFTYYDGVISGKTNAINDEEMISEIETAYELTHTTNGSYKEVHLETSYVIVTFEYNGGVETETTRGLTAGSQLGTLPSTSREGYTFLGWFDEDDHEISATRVINNNEIFYAHWKRDTVARIGTEEYATLPEALATVGNNTPTTITILKDITLNGTVSISSAKNITFNLNGHNINYTGGNVIENFGTLTVTDSAGGGSITGGRLNGTTYIPAVNNKSGGTFTLSGGTISSDVSQVFENNGSFTMTGGKITIANIAQGVVNNNAGAVMDMSGGTIEAPIAGSKRQGIYNKGTVNISGTAVITSATSDRGVLHNDYGSAVINISGGTITSTNTNCQKGAIHNDKGATVKITGGTITSKSTNNNASAVQNAGTLTIGNKDGNINASSPYLISEKYAVSNNGNNKFYFYDGVLYGKSNTINGKLTETESNSTRNDTTEVIDGVTYHKTYLS